MLIDLKTIDTILKMEVLDNRAFVLNEIANYTYKKISENKVPKLNFICTHNSRRSQFCQFWATFFLNIIMLSVKFFLGVLFKLK